MYIVLGIIGFLLVMFYFMYVKIVKLKIKAYEAFSGIDVQLKKRHDIIPNVLAIAKKFMEHEKTLMNEITKLRTDAQKVSSEVTPENIEKRIDIENKLQSKLGSFFVSVENYPDLKSNQNMLHAQNTYNEVEEHISASRRFYNAAVTQLNTSVEIFPGSMIASMIGIRPMTFFKANEEDRKAVNAADLL